MADTTRVAIFSAHQFEKAYLDHANKSRQYELNYIETRLNAQTALLAKDMTIICAFVSDELNLETLTQLKNMGVKLIALRSAGFNNVDLVNAEKLNLPVVRVPEYSPYAVAEHAVALLLALNRKIPKAHARVRDLNFNLDGLVGFDLHGKTVGVIGTGKIGAIFCKIMRGFGCRIISYDTKVNPDLSGVVEYSSLNDIYEQSDVISLHVPLTPETHHLIDDDVLKKLKRNVTLINTGRGALIDTTALINALKDGSIGGAALDVYEEEEGVFFQDLSAKVLKDDVLARLLTFPNVLITAHQAFLTNEALTNIAETTLQNIDDYLSGKPLKNGLSSKIHLNLAR